jgi:hypothetical protein
MGAFECSWFMSKPFLFLTVLTAFFLSFSHGEVALFNGQDLSGWQAQDMSYWSVVDGAIVGTAGESRGTNFFGTKERSGTFIYLFPFVRFHLPQMLVFNSVPNPEQVNLHLDTRLMWERDGGAPFTMSMVVAYLLKIGILKEGT